MCPVQRVATWVWGHGQGSVQQPGSTEKRLGGQTSCPHPAGNQGSSPKLSPGWGTGPSGEEAPHSPGNEGKQKLLTC